MHVLFHIESKEAGAVHLRESIGVSAAIDEIYA